MTGKNEIKSEFRLTTSETERRESQNQNQNKIKSGARRAGEKKSQFSQF